MRYVLAIRDLANSTLFQDIAAIDVLEMCKNLSYMPHVGMYEVYISALWEDDVMMWRVGKKETDCEMEL